MKSSHNLIKAGQPNAAQPAWSPTDLGGENKPEARPFQAPNLAQPRAKGKIKPGEPAQPQSAAPQPTNPAKAKEPFHLLHGQDPAATARWEPEELAFPLFEPPPSQTQTRQAVVQDVANDLATARQRAYNEAQANAQAKAEAVLAKAKATAHALLEKAVSEARQIRAETTQQSQALLLRAQAQAGEVTNQAQAEGMAAAEAEAERLLRSARTVLDEVIAWRESILAQSEKSVLMLVMEIAHKLFGSGIVLDQDTLRSVFSRAVADAKSLGDLLVRAHPDDAAILAPFWAEQVRNQNGRVIELVPDPSIRRGGCLVEGQFGLVDARINTMLKAVDQTLVETLENHEERQS